ncbi:uncharacterized protein LAJ45_08582 [Morchella importuna]|uniref:uncharacterized protein n=1 Tax=Morchella importuna TaxID=1174673 RepID=UPI001E8D0599|nr:uncharacterized protein LAJ45_08582 [Morchella importuna]KAH8147426.1 hypothetical protein LAJ45_08582 [Morchella importuna]
MAPISTDLDFLNDALKNKTRLPYVVRSWKSTFARLTSPNRPSQATISSLTAFLTSPISIDSLAQCYSPFPRPSAASKADFERRTAAINFTAADLPMPGIAELKDAALELSRSLEIDEVSALRIVVLEYQSRPAGALLASDANSGEDAPGSLPNQVEKPVMSKDEEFFSRVSVYMSERRYIIKTATFLVRAAITADRKDNVWREVGKRFEVEGIVEKGGLAGKCIDGIAERWNEGRKGGEGLPNWVRSRLEGSVYPIAYKWEQQTLWEILHLLQLIFVLLYKSLEDSSVTLVIKWFDLMKETAFLSHRTYVPFPEAFEIINLYKFTTPLTSIISTTILQHPRTEKHLQKEYVRTFSAESSATPPAHGPARRVPPPADDSSFYIESPKAIKAVTSCFVTTSSAPGAAVPALAWSLIVLDIISFVNAASQEEDSDPFSNASAGRGERHPTVELYENVLSGLFEGSAEKEIKRLANSTVRDALEAIVLMIEPSGTIGEAFLGAKFWIGSEEDGYRMKNVLASLVRKALPDLNISGEVLMTVLLVHELQYNDLASYIRFLDDEAEKGGDDSTGWTSSAAGRFMKHGEAMRFLRRTKNRFPYEPILFLRLIRALALESGEVTKDLVKMDTYTQVLPPGFEDYDVDNEDSDIGRIQLTSDLLVFAPRDEGVFEDEYAPRGGIVIPAGTIGEITSTGGGRLVVAWKHEYNALPLLGRVLEYALIGEGSASGAGRLMAGELGTGETATEIISLLTMLIASGTARPDKAAEGFDVARILEEASDNVGRSRDVVSIIFDLLEAGLQATAQSSNTGKSTEFIVAALQFVDALIKVLPGRVWPFIARSTILERNGRGGAFVSILSAVEVVRGDYEFTINCLNLFEHLVEEAIESSVVNMGGSRSLQLASMAASTTTRSGVSMPVQREILTSWTRVTVDVFESYRGWKYVNNEQRLDIGRRIARIFSAILLQVYGVDDSTDISTKVTHVLGPSAEHLVKVFLSESESDLHMEPIIGAIHDGLMTPETSLHLRSLNGWIEHNIAIIGFAEVCIRVRGYLDLPPSYLEMKIYGVSASLAKLYATHDRYRQPVLELFESLVVASGTATTEPPSLLGHLGAECASHFATVLRGLDKPFDDELLESRIWGFVSAVVSNKQQGLSILLLRGETLWKGNLSTRDKAPKSSLLSVALDSLSDIDKLSAGRSLAMLEAVALSQNFWSLAMEDLGKHPKFIKAITSHVESLTIEFLPADSKEIITEKANKVAVAACIAQLIAMHLHSRQPSSAVKISGYRASLHGHLQKNFEEKWPSLTLLKLKKTRLRRREYGTGYFYDMELAAKVLGFDPSWAGRADGYASEVEQANLNLSLVDSQVVLLRAWQLLAMELCDFVSTTKELEQPLIDLVESCLAANIESGFRTPIFTKIICERAEFAFVIMRRLQQSISTANSASHFDRILGLAWKSIQSSSSEFRQSLATANVSYYRSLLRILYIALYSNSTKEQLSTAMAYTILDILNLVVTKGFKDLATAAHDYPETTNPDDIALITAILQAALKLKGMEVVHSGLGIHIHENGTIRVATTLFSWSEQLAIDGDPVYGELSALFLLELSSVQIIAEQLAVEGILELLVNSSLSNKIRQGVSPTSDPRLYAIWNRGLLPITLNLLTHIGPRIAREVVAFLQFFGPQLENAVSAWQSHTMVTLSAVNEATTIVMLMTILARMGVKVDSEGSGQGLKFDKATLCEQVDYLLTHKTFLKTLIMPTNLEEEEMMKRGDAEDNELTEKVLNDMAILQGLLSDDEAEE